MLTIILAREKTYVNHIWFFYASDLDRNGENFELVTQENLSNAPISSIVIWESHYAHRLMGNVQLDYFKNNSNFREISRIVTPNKRFGVVIFEKIKS